MADLITRAHGRIATLRRLLYTVRQTEAAARVPGNRKLRSWTAGLARVNLAEFMAATCRKPMPPALASLREACSRQDLNGHAVLSIPLGGMPLDADPLIQLKWHRLELLRHVREGRAELARRAEERAFNAQHGIESPRYVWTDDAIIVGISARLALHGRHVRAAGHYPLTKLVFAEREIQLALDMAWKRAEPPSHSQVHPVFAGIFRRLGLAA